MGWRETLGGAVSELKPLPNTTQNTQNPTPAQKPNPEQVGFGGSGGFGYRNETGKLAEAQTQAGLRAALSGACEGLPLSQDQMVQAFGTEGEADWLEGYEPHCRPEFLRAFAETVAARNFRKILHNLRAEPEPPAQSPQNTQNRKPEPNPLEGLSLLREDWELIESRTRGRRNRESLLAEYARRWKEAAEAEPVEHRKANAGRFAANTWLRGVRP